MGLLDDLANAGPRQSKYCSVGKALADHPEHAPDLQEALDAHPLYAYEAISEVLAANGIEISAGVLGRHNGRRCKCSQPPRNQ